MMTSSFLREGILYGIANVENVVLLRMTGNYIGFPKLALEGEVIKAI
jgi:hypothetical protein